MAGERYNHLGSNEQQTQQAASEAKQGSSAENLRPRLNPRLVFNDPDAFFADLIIEQSEQG